MAIANRELAIVIKVVNDQLVAGINQAKSAVTNFAQESSAAIDQVEAKSENLAHVWKGLFEAFIGVEIVDVLKKIADGADDAANRLQIAANTAKNFGHALDPNELEKWLDAFARSPQGGGYALPDMRNAVQTFAASGQDENQQKRALADATNLAATFGLTLPEAVRVTNEALTGHVELLTRYGIISREAAKNIHTVEEAMQALETASAGGAEKRADGLAGAFGRLGTSVNLLGNAFGQYLIPYFEAVANGLAHLAEAVSALPPWLLQAVAGLTFVTLSLTALGLVLPAIKLAIEFLAGGFGILRVAAGLLVGGLQITTAAAAALPEVLAAVRGGFISAEEGEALLSATTTRTQGVLGLLRTFIGGPLVAVFNGFVSILRSVITALAVDLVGADAAAAGSFAAMLAPILAVIAVIAGVIAAAVALSGHWNDVMHGLSTAWDEFYNNVLTKASTLQKIIAAVAMSVNPATMAVGGQELSAVLHGAMPKTTGWIDTGVKDATAAIVGAVKTAWAEIVKFFSGGGASVPIPKDKFGNTMPDGGKGTAEKAAENALKNFEESIKNWLQRFADAVDAAKAKSDTATANLDTFRAKYTDSGKPDSSHQAQEIAGLITAQYQAQYALRQRIAEQQRAEIEAEQQFERAAAAVSPHLKNHDQLVRQALDAALQHKKAAEQLGVQYAQMGATLAQIIKSFREDLSQGVEADVAKQIGAVKARLDAAQSAIANQQYNLSAGEDLRRESGKERPEEHAAYQVNLDALALASAQAAAAAAADTVALRAHAFAVEHSQAAHDALTTAQHDLTTATTGVRSATNKLATDTVTYDKTMADRYMTAGKALDDLVVKLNVPGLQQRQGGGFTFSPWQFLLDALEQTKAFADVMKFVSQIVKVFAQLLDNLRPVLDVVIRIVSDVANVFIFLYNTVARILRLFGIHLQLLDAINSAYSDQIPLIQITHNLPTLNELGAGKLNSPLSPNPVGSADNLASIGNTHTSLLESILATLIAIKLTEMVFGHGGGGGGGIMSFLGNLFNGGGGAPAAASNPLQGALNAINTIPGTDADAVSAGTQTALAADGASTSGGLFTAMNGALQTAAPYLATAIAGSIGVAIGGGGTGSQILSGIGGIVGTIFGGPVGGAIGSFLGGIVGGLFGGHKSPAGPKPTTQTTEFTALLHAATDVHAWMNGLTSSASTMIQGIGAASSQLVSAAQNLNKAADNLKATGSSTTFNHQTNFGGIKVSNDLDVRELSRDLANDTMRANQSFQFSIGRAPIG